MEMHEKDELLEELMLIHTLVDENPCRMPSNILHAIAQGVRVLIGSHIGGGASREQAARYFKRDVRTLTRWKEEFDDFPKARHMGHKESNYSWIDLINWKTKHKDLWKED